VILRCLAKHPDDRYASARAVLDALREGRASGGALPDEARPRGENSGSARSEDATPTTAMPRARPPRPAGRRRALVALGLVAAATALWASVRPRASLVVHNRLTEPIAVTLDDTGFTVAAGDSLRTPLRARAALEAHWAMVRPTEPGGRMLGNEVEGTIARDDVRGEVRQIVGAGTDGRRWFSPLVVNATARRLHVTVVSGRDTSDCGCSIAPGDSLRLGYYPLVPAAGVRVRDTTRAMGRFDAMLSGVDSVSGAVVFRVAPSSMIVPPRVPRPEGRARSTAPPNPLKGFLPVR
jgi:hypothetical protein